MGDLTPPVHAIEGYYGLMAENATLVQILPEVGILLGIFSSPSRHGASGSSNMDPLRNASLRADPPLSREGISILAEVRDCFVAALLTMTRATAPSASRGGSLAGC